jgi:hypothetical protein
MTNLLSPEQSKRELEGNLELEELADRLDGEEHEQVSSFDLVYSKDRRESSKGQGSTYTLDETGTEWYDEEALENIEVPGLEIDVQLVKMNAVTGETVLVDSEGQKTRYDIRSSFEGSNTFTQEVGRNTYVFRYDKQEDEVKAVEVGGDMEPSRWGNPDLKKRAELMDHMYHEAREKLWQQKTEDEIEAHNSNFDQLRPVYNKVTGDIEQSDSDRCVIDEHTHVGSTRGGHVKKDFKRAVRRAPNDSLDNYNIKNDGNGYPIIIEEV